MNDTVQSKPVDAPLVEPIERVEISYAVYQRIREKVSLRDLAPDNRIDLDYRPDSFRVSRTTLERPYLEELVVVVPSRGTFVRRFDASQVIKPYGGRYSDIYSTG